MSTSFDQPALTLTLSLLGRGRVIISPDTLQDAYDDFGWNEWQIVDHLKLLTIDHCYNDPPHVDYPGCTMFCFRMRDVDPKVYTHFHIDSDYIHVSSFKKL